MCEERVDKPLYLLIADWVMAEKRWVSAKEIAKQFNMDHCKASNTVSYILAEVAEIHCETKTIPNQLEGRGCQCQRLVRVTHIAPQLYARLGQGAQQKMVNRTPQMTAVPPSELNREQKWQMMLSKSLRR
ncbi:carnitine metabolism transcriptional regulator CaiF [Citrobacter rodentium]|uniref:Transcriptional activator n=2 Tax=Citrobacter rodentium TaxID=67825 RepID=D2TGM1_CITRI|nr:carnitine metabolism transcriptional regulator CaiF [Citrobacter rodentium]KIQ51196.1 transcriptional regulator [Citrobacter rodentium]QBY31293.1 carnitine metabolism transcriptional regulator CaiF [Citrobacter rodentium]UHO31344.1 carnitine metabolism transcriptional regulator CaiF [Citrobacter rodentium NBRC 105723 = DSM 16636]CBG86818.1 transcriptional activator [Citrobacter rodentium ICC168]HAT8012994.1 CaiF/GrlA family transcriptional regulator [Citrobacter rodentium NBRC 105723 = DSM 